MENEQRDENDLDVTSEFAAVIEKLLERILALELYVGVQQESIKMLGELYAGHQKIIEALTAAPPVRPPSSNLN
jgi:hypothetical protein